MTNEQLEKRFQDLQDLLKDKSEKDREIIKQAWEFAKEAHAGQKRLTGDPYTSHLVETAVTLANWKMDTTTIIAGLLHDTIEDAHITKEELEKEFGSEVALLIHGVSKVSGLRLKSGSMEQTVETLRKMILVMAQDLRVVFVKLADRRHNMQTLHPLSTEKQRKIAKETIELFSPLAERIGMGSVKGDLEELAFPYLYPEEFQRINKESKPYYERAGKHIKKMKSKIAWSLEQEKINHSISGRQKNKYSLWRKLQRTEVDWDFEKIHDIVALRVLVDDLKSCYTALGIIHSLYRPVPKLGISDFIAQPKPNGYRSIHTKVFGPGGRIVEIQIRTFEMHENAEYGVAAHWAYAEEKSRSKDGEKLEKEGASVNKKLTWVKQLVQWQKELADSEEFINAVKFDGFQHRNFVFTPKGDVFDLPRDATPVDFAYTVHTGLGHYIQGAKVNGKMVPLDHKLVSGDIVEIIKSKNPRLPNKTWLDFVVTTIARREINKKIKSDV